MNRSLEKITVTSMSVHSCATCICTHYEAPLYQQQRLWEPVETINGCDGNSHDAHYVKTGLQGCQDQLCLTTQQVNVLYLHSLYDLVLVLVGVNLCTYNIAMPQCFPALSPAAWKPDRPMRATVGVMVRGPIYFSRIPGRPSAPIHTSTRDDTIIAPWIWPGKDRNRGQQKFSVKEWLSVLKEKHPCM